MTTLTINTHSELKSFVSENRKLIVNINNVEFNDLYPMLQVSNKHALYYDVNTSSNKYLSEPFVITVKKKLPTFAVTYTKKFDGSEGKIFVKANDEAQAIINAKNICASGSDFRNPVLTVEEYSKPRKQGFAGRN